MMMEKKSESEWLKSKNWKNKLVNQLKKHVHGKVFYKKW